MFKQLSIGAMVISSFVLPAVTQAHGLDLKTNAQVKLASQTRLEERHDNGNHFGQMKKKQDLQVSMTGTLTAMSGTSLTIKLPNGTSYTVDASAAKFVRRFGGAMVMGDLQLNDQLFVKGTLNEAMIKASMVQDLSLQARKGEFSGVVQSVNGTSFVLKTNNRGLQTINTNASTSVMKADQKVNLADVLVGATVKVDGVWNRVNDNLLAQNVRIVVRTEEVRLNGRLTAVNGASVTMLGTDGKTYTVDAAKAKLSGNGYFGTDMSKLKVGDSVQVWGKSETGSLKVNANFVVDFSLSI